MSDIKFAMLDFGLASTHRFDATLHLRGALPAIFHAVPHQKLSMTQFLMCEVE